jgi:predicted nuclease of restriction endonuclease-like RecB superfamily
MLTADLVETRRSGSELKLVKLEGKRRRRALDLAEQYLAIIGASRGQTRAAIREGLRQVEVAASERKLADGLLKLLDDASTWATGTDLDSADLRREVFLRASTRHAALGARERLDRKAVLEDVASERGLTREALERALYADLRDEQILEDFEAVTPEALVARYALAREQAVLLRSVRVVAEVLSASPETYRYLFRQLKFRRLLYRLERAEPGGFRITLDGPYSLFESVTRYGLQLALVLPALKACDRYRIEADLRWGKGRRRLGFVLEGRAREPAPPFEEGRSEVASLAREFTKLGSDWAVAPAETLLDLPGVGLVVPDLLFEHEPSGEQIHFEALGFWSRQAVWRRVDLVRKGLAAITMFAVSSRLRVSEAVLEEDSSGALYVYKGRMSAREVLSRLERLRRRRGARSGSRDE